MKRKVLFAGALFLALGVTMLLSQQGQLAFSHHRQCPAGRFPDFIPMSGVSPRGVAVDKVGNVYVSASVGTGVNEHIKIWKFTPAGEPPFSTDTFLADIGQGTIGGLMVSANGDLYVALAAGLDRGVYRMDRWGNIELLPGSDQIFFANGLAFDDRGTLYITESVSLMGPPPPFGQGGIWRIPRGRPAELCLRNELLTGTGVLGQPVPIGANGIAYYHGNLYVTNTEKGTVLRIPIQKHGNLGLPLVWATLQDVPESPLAEAPLPVCGDGLILDVFGNVYVAVLTRSAVVRINPWNRSQTTVAAFRIPAVLPLYAPLDFPASLFFGTGKGERRNLFVTNMGLGAVLVPPLPWAGPGLVKIDAGRPGRPLH
jgi:sugar lactone lactonase YvrE